MNTQKPYLKAIDANLTALWEILNTTMTDVDSALQAIGQGRPDGAFGAIIPTEESLKQAGILVQAILVLHRQR